MKSNITIIFPLFCIFLLAACSGSATPNEPVTGAETANPSPPPEYSGKVNPAANDATAIETGRQLFTANCASCHGTLGKGDGPAAGSLNPKPKDLASEMKQVQDDYLFWRISEGGMIAPFHSVMPAWKSILTEDQIWQIIAFMRTLEP